MIKKTAYLLSFLLFSSIHATTDCMSYADAVRKHIPEDVKSIHSETSSPGITPEMMPETSTECLTDKLHLPPNDINILIYIQDNEHNLEFMKSICESKSTIKMLEKLGYEIINNQLWYVCEDSRPADCVPNDYSWPLIILK